MADIQAVENFLKLRFIHASHEWVSACVEWYKSENPQVPSQLVLNEAVYTQWLLCDLRDMEIGCLPENIKLFKKFTLNGKYAVQIHYVIDVGQPAYNQWQKLKKIDTTNQEVTAEKPMYQKKQTNRVLNLFICDGLQEVQGMEYEFIPKLNTNLVPGVKALLSGPIESRNGVLFLHDKNIEILGGEIEDLLCSNAYENVLARMLNYPENPTPMKNVISTDANEEISNDMGITDDDLLAGIPMEVTSIIQNTDIRPKEPRTVVTNKRSSNSQAVIDDEVRKLEQDMDDCDFHNFDSGVFNDEFSHFPENHKNRSEPDRKYSNTIKPPNVSLNPISTSTSRKRPAPDDENVTFELFDDDDFANTVNTLDISPEALNFPKENSKIKSETVPTVVSCNPYVYIQQLIENKQIICHRKFTVKACVTSIVTKLTFVKKQWSLKCEIRDATACMVVDFSNSVLEKIIGYTSAEMVVIKKHMATSNFYKDQLLQALDKAKEKFYTLDCLMDLEFKESEDDPQLVGLTAFSSHHMAALKNRTEMVVNGR